MSRERAQRAEELFQRASDLEPDARERFLAAECGTDPSLRCDVESLLRHGSEASPRFLAGGAATRERAERVLESGRFVGRYRVLHLLGQGGMGDVYEAEQEQPRRKVALKLIRSDRSNADAQRRFRLEAEVLGQLKHPGIAQIFEAGTARTKDAAGRDVVQPFLAMELVSGELLHEYAARMRLRTRERLELVARVCDALEHAHQKGVIHRDLKPSNILVIEGEMSAGAARSAQFCAQPKILDFGVARVVAPDSAEALLDTRDGQVVGTLAYMSPEQMSGVPEGVDTRSDVYSIGVVLYELLAGRPPYSIAECSLPDAVMTLRDGAPTPLSSSRPDLRGDIETIVARAMEKDRARRYQSASELAWDIRRFLRGEPIEARRDSRLYVLGRHMRLYWRLTAAVALFVLLLGSFAVVSSVQAERNRVLAVSERIASEQARDGAAAAERAKANAEMVSDLLLSLFESANSHSGHGADVSVRELLDQFTEEQALQIAESPEVEATLRIAIGKAYVSISEPQRAELHFRRALELRKVSRGERQHDIAEAQLEWATSLVALREFDRAEAVLLESIELHRGLREAPDACEIRLSYEIGRVYRAQLRHEEAAFALRNAIELSRCVWPIGSHIEVIALSELAGIELARSNPAEAETYLREAVAVCRGPVAKLVSDLPDPLTRLAEVRRVRGDPREAEQLAREAIALSLPTHGESHQFVATQLDTLGKALLDRKDPRQAAAVFEHALDIRSRKGPAWAKEMLSSKGNLATALRQCGDLDGALALRQETLAERRTLFGEASPEVALDLHNLGVLLSFMGRPAEAEVPLREALEIRRRQAGGELALADTLLNLGIQLEEQGKLEQAAPAFREALEIHRRILGERHARTFAGIRRLSDVLRRLGSHEEADPLLREALELAEVPGFTSADHLASAVTGLGLNLDAMGQHGEAEPLLRRSVELWRSFRGSEHDDVAQSLFNLGRFLSDQERHAEAEPILRESIAMFERTLPGSHRRLSPMSVLGETLHASGNTEEGEALLRTAAQGLVDAADASPIQRRMALERLVRHYERTEQELLAGEWRQRLEQL